MKKVLLIGSELGKGGAERSISLLSYYLEQLKYDVTLCILSGKDREKYYRTCEKVVFVDPPEYSGTWGKIKAWRYRINRIKSLKEGMDVSISFLEGPDYVNAITKRKEKVVLSIRGSKVHDKEIKGQMGKVRKNVLIPMLYKRADEIVCVTHTLANELKHHFGISPKKLKTIYNFYETDRIVNMSNEALSENEAKIFSQPVIITSGRLHVAKEQDKLIRILQLVKQTTEARLVILGDGELKDELIMLSGELGLTVCDWQKEQKYYDADVYLMGFQSNAFKFYRHSKLFALASSWEGFPNVLAESLICNIPAVTTDCYTGPREILNVSGLEEEPVQKAIRTLVGSLLPLLDNIDESHMQEWTKEILHWLNAPTPPTQAFEVLIQRFTLEAMLRQWKEVIED